jgi:hypothetical protein
MRSHARIGSATAALCLAFGALHGASRAVTQNGDATLPRCVEAEAMILTKLDSATTNSGDSFAFKITAPVVAGNATPTLAAGTRGYGIVSFADHAHGSGQPGRLVVEPRFLRLADGTHVQVLADPQVADNFVQGATRNLNGALGFVPGLGLAVGGYNALHRGREVTIAKGTAFSLIVGDQLAAGECYVAPPSELNVR